MVKRFKFLPFLSLIVLGLVQCVLVFLILTSIYGLMQAEIYRTQGVEITPLEGARLVIERGWAIAEEAWGRLIQGDLPGLWQSLVGQFGARAAPFGGLVCGVVRMRRLSLADSSAGERDG